MKAARAGRKAHSAYFRRHSVIVEKKSQEAREAVRLMMLRDEIPALVEIVRSSRQGMACVVSLLEDEHVAVGTIAADVLREAALEGVDLARAVPALYQALGDRYAKANAAGALTHHFLRRGDIQAVQSLLGSKDAVVRDAAGESCMHGCDAGKMPL